MSPSRQSCRHHAVRDAIDASLRRQRHKEFSATPNCPSSVPSCVVRDNKTCKEIGGRGDFGRGDEMRDCGEGRDHQVTEEYSTYDGESKLSSVQWRRVRRSEIVKARKRGSDVFEK